MLLSIKLWPWKFYNYLTSWYVKKNLYLFFVHILAADLLISTLLLPISSYFFLKTSFPMDSWCCLAWGIVDSSLNFISTACLALISVDRGLSIYSPIRYRVNRTATLVKVLLGILWILAPILSGLIVYIIELSSDQETCSLRGLHSSKFNRFRLAFENVFHDFNNIVFSA